MPAVLHAVNERLRMLHADADGESLGLESHPCSAQHLEDVPGRVSRSEHDPVSQQFAAVRKSDPNARRPIVSPLDE